MRIVAFVVATVMLGASLADATPADDLQTKGQQLAKDGRYSDAIEAFKAADRLEPRAANACLIALAYTRRELWPQAELFLHLCHTRATAADALPDWVPAADAQIAERLATANVALVDITVVPDVPVKLTVSSFALDEVLTQRSIHLPYGHNVVLASADGYEPAQRDLEITDRSHQHITIELHKRAADTVGTPPPTIAPTAMPVVVRPAHASASKLPWLIMAGGGALALGGLATDLFWVQPLRDKLMTTNAAQYAANSGSFDNARDVTYAMYGVGAAAAVAGVILHYTKFRGPADTQMRITGDTVNGGGVIQLEWTR